MNDRIAYLIEQRYINCHQSDFFAIHGIMASRLSDEIFKRVYCCIFQKHQSQ